MSAEVGWSAELCVLGRLGEVGRLDEVTLGSGEVGLGVKWGGWVKWGVWVE